MSEFFTRNNAYARINYNINSSKVAGLKGRLIQSVFVLSLFLSLSTLSPVFAQAANVPGKAMITIESISKSQATRGKNLVVTYYADQQCGRRGKTDRVFKKNYVDDEHRFNPLAVDTDMPFIFQVSYTEKRRNETRSCAAISSVELKANRTYKAVFEIVEEVIGCNISVVDVTDVIAAESALEAQLVAKESGQAIEPSSDIVVPTETPVVDAKPENTCVRVGKEGYKSGTPVYSYKDRLG